MIYRKENIRLIWHKHLLILFFGLITSFLNVPKAYSQPIARNIDFIHHLISINNQEETHWYIENLLDLPIEQKWEDSLLFLNATVYYQQQQFYQAKRFWAALDSVSQLYPKAKLLEIHANMQLGNWEEAHNKLYVFNHQPYTEIHTLQQFALDLLQRKSEIQFPTQKNKPVLYANSYNKLVFINQQIKQYRPKRMWLAGTLSAIVPGLGKVYVGRPYEGLAAFWAVTGLGILTAEQANRNGFSDYRTLAVASLFTVFYLGNIYGASISARLQNEEFNHETNHQILLAIRIPVEQLLR